MTPPEPDPTGDEMRKEFRQSVRGVLRQAAAARGPQPVWASETTDTFALGQAEALGWTGLLVEERWGGAGAGMLEMIIVAEELGAHLTSVPFLSNAVLGCTALSVGGSRVQQERWLPALASGRLRSAALLTGPSGRTGADLLGMRVIDDGEGMLLRGESGFVLDGVGADLLVVAARRSGEADPDLFLVEGGSAGIETTALLSVDRTRQLTNVAFHDVRVEAAARLPRSVEALQATLDRGAVALAADAVGAATRAFEMAVDYAGHREQFGRPIGSFQAVKHKLADMYVLIQGAAAAVEGAARALDEGHDPRCLIAVAASYAKDAATTVAGDAIQVHGGIGYTWEHNCHRLFKRAKFDEAFLGDPSVHRDRLARSVLDRSAASRT
ncbi:acyl-CoA dehydrogenase family protein [Dactylosporangium sp. AC04546]|uniref:acyl-CoA dehydrogenase family protein n=1 Tax=Dactylosporangium sp. AC04546 TaxID=2862460 RepID=UPI001EDD6A0E|nr:acyl-CoA dehydrogenase family protein [Dactylosporangium sp. AC04546]WVK86969.1 acyl-CoA dehydrogenase family protein [Dactylosporangium sp. AC04546]